MKARQSQSIQDAAHGTIALVFSEGCFYVLGYFTVVILARELGPQAYAIYGVVLSVLLWLEGAGRRPIPFASAKLLAESTDGQEELEKSALALNLGLYSALFALLWLAAPWLEAWFKIAHGTFLFRLAAIDLPLFGVYTATGAIHQGHRRFTRLAASKVVYAVSKLTGALAIVYLGISVEKALLANAFATLAGLTFLLFGIHLPRRSRWLARVSPLIRLAIPIGFYSFALPLLGWMNLWTLQVLSSPAQAATIGVFVGALNIARVPGFTLATVASVLLPSVSRALARNDLTLARQYIDEALRFFLILYLPACLLLMARPEALMQWIYSKDFAGGGVLLSILVIGSGLSTLQTILSSILIASGLMKRVAVVTCLALLPALLIVSALTYSWGARGAAISAVVVPLLIALIFATQIAKQFGTLLKKRSVLNIGLAGGLMFLSDALIKANSSFIWMHLVSLIIYACSLFISGEITHRDLSLFFLRKRAK